MLCEEHDQVYKSVHCPAVCNPDTKQVFEYKIALAKHNLPTRHSLSQTNHSLIWKQPCPSSAC